jgi:hypothetical protein
VQDGRGAGWVQDGCRMGWVQDGCRMGWMQDGCVTMCIQCADSCSILRARQCTNAHRRGTGRQGTGRRQGREACGRGQGEGTAVHVRFPQRPPSLLSTSTPCPPTVTATGRAKSCFLSPPSTASLPPTQFLSTDPSRIAGWAGDVMIERGERGSMGLVRLNGRG